jgi:hypothetical protein
MATPRFACHSDADIEAILNHWTYTFVLTTVVNSVLKFMINETTSILKSYIFQICAAIYQLLLHMVFTSRNWFVLQGPVAIILISWNVIFIWETGYWTRAIQRFALFDLLKSLYSDTKILSKYIPSLQKRLETMDFHIMKMYKDNVSTKMSKIFFYQCVT